MSNTRGGDELLKENVQSDSNVDAPVVGPKKESRRRRASLVPDMDAGGQRLQPNFSANARAANVSSSVWMDACNHSDQLAAAMPLADQNSRTLTF